MQIMPLLKMTNADMMAIKHILEEKLVERLFLLRN